MLEIYLFINPVGAGSLKAEKQVMEIAKEVDDNIYFRFIPIVSMRTIDAVMKRNNISGNIELRNRWFETSYSASLDLKAIQLQGRKKARLFLTKMQERIGVERNHYSKKLVLDLLEEIGADVDVFLEDRLSDLVKRAFLKDQKIAHEMGVTSVPSAVLFNFDNKEDGVLIEEHIAKNLRLYYQIYKKKNDLGIESPDILDKTNNILPFQSEKQADSM